MTERADAIIADYIIAKCYFSDRRKNHLASLNSLLCKVDFELVEGNESILAVYRVAGMGVGTSPRGEGAIQSEELLGRLDYAEGQYRRHRVQRSLFRFYIEARRRIGLRTRLKKFLGRSAA